MLVGTMDVYEPFVVENIEAVLSEFYCVPRASNKLYFLVKINALKYVLEVQTIEKPSEGVVEVRDKFILIKAPNISMDTGSQSGSIMQQNRNISQPKFQLLTKTNVNFNVYHINLYDSYKEPRFNSVEDIKAILNKLNQYQQQFFDNSSTNTRQIDAILVREYSSIIEALDLDITSANIVEALSYLAKELDDLFKSDILVPSVWMPGGNVLIKQDNSSVFLSFGTDTNLRPLAYDALMYMFSFSDETFRQHHFADLINYYFAGLTNLLDKENADKYLKINSNEKQVRILLPLVKLDQIRADPRRPRNLMNNICNFFKLHIINQEDIYEVLSNYLRSSDYELCNYNLCPLTEKNGHLGEYYHLDITVNFDKKVNNLNLFAKFLIIPVKEMKILVENGPAKTEDFFYKILCPLYVENGLEKILDFAPRCFLSKINRLVVLDDLIRAGYKSLKPNVVLHYEEIVFVINKLAKLHASSIVLEEILSKKSGTEVRLNELFKGFLIDKMEQFEGEPTFLKTFLEKTRSALHYVVNKCPDITSPLCMSEENIKEKVNEVYSLIFKSPSNKLRKVINHGDTYLGNVLIKFTDDNKPLEAMLIDFQMLNYFPPTAELLGYIFTLSIKDTRDRHLQDLLDHYYVEFCNILTKFDLDPEKLFPRDLFDQDIKANLASGILTAFGYNHVTHIDPDFRIEIMHDAEKFKYYLEDHREEVIEMSWENVHYRTVMRGLIEDIVNFIKSDCS